jgi:putative transferase (TIGR04331 family)
LIDSKSEWFDETTTVFRQVLDQVATNLNEIHDVHYSVRYWNIFAGVWLQQFVDLVITQLSTQPLITTTSSIHFPPSQTIREFQSFAKNENFIKQLRSDIGANNYRCISKDEKQIKLSVDVISNRSIPKFGRTYVSATYLPRISEVKLQLRFGRLTSRLRPTEVQRASIDTSLRRLLLVKSDLNPSISQLIVSLFPKYMPCVFLESFKSLSTTQSPWRSKRFPKVIFTSNRHLYDDLFNFWVAHATELGSRLVLGQHGGFYGISEFPSYAERHEKQIADRYLTWGWSNEGSSIAGPATIIVRTKPIKRNSPKHLLFVTDQLFTIPRSIFSDIGESSSYLANIKLLIDGITTARSDVLVRIPITHAESGYSQIGWINEHLPQTAIDTGEQGFRRLLKSSKLVVIPHNGTTLIESIALEVPTVIVWDKSIVWMRSESEVVFNALEQVGIFHRTPESAASFINLIWNDVDGWWNSHSTIEARKQFTDQYARTVPNPVRFLAQALQF